MLNAIIQITVFINLKYRDINNVKKYKQPTKK